MTVILFKNNQKFKYFKKYFENFRTGEIRQWTETHFLNAKEKQIDFKTNTIYIFY